MKLIITLILTIASLLSYSQNVTIKVAGSGGGGGGGGSNFITQNYLIGDTVNVSSNSGWLIINPASVINSLVINLNQTYTEGQLLNINFGGTITNGNYVLNYLKILGNIYQSEPFYSLPILAGDSPIILKYNLTNNIWYRL